MPRARADTTKLLVGPTGEFSGTAFQRAVGKTTPSGASVAGGGGATGDFFGIGGTAIDEDPHFDMQDAQMKAFLERHCFKADTMSGQHVFREWEAT